MLMNCIHRAGGDSAGLIRHWIQRNQDAFLDLVSEQALDPDFIRRLSKDPELKQQLLTALGSPQKTPEQALSLMFQLGLSHVKYAKLHASQPTSWPPLAHLIAVLNKLYPTLVPIRLISAVAADQEAALAEAAEAEAAERDPSDPPCRPIMVPCRSQRRPPRPPPRCFSRHDEGYPQPRAHPHSDRPRHSRVSCNSGSSSSNNSRRGQKQAAAGSSNSLWQYPRSQLR